MCGVSDANIRQLLARETLVGIKQDDGGYLLDIENEKNRDYLNKKMKLAKDISLDIGKLAEGFESDVAQVNHDIIATLTQRIEDLAKQAGKAELLTDNIIQEKRDAEFWRNKYFEIQHACESLRFENEKIKTEIEKENEEVIEQNQDLQELNEKLKKDNMLISKQLSEIKSENETLKRQIKEFEAKKFSFKFWN